MVDIRDIQAASVLIRDEHKENILKVEEELTGNEILNVANEFKRVVNLGALNTQETNDLINYVVNFVPNQDLRSLLLESINLVKSPIQRFDPFGTFRSRPLKEELEFGLVGQNVQLSIPRQDILNLRESTENINATFENEVNRVNQFRQTFRQVQGKENAIVVINKRITSLLSNVNQSAQISQNLMLQINRDRSLYANRSIDISTRVSAAKRVIKLVNQHLNNAVGRVFQREVPIQKIGKVPLAKDLPSARKNLRFFIKGVRDSEKKKKKENEFFVKALGKEFKKALMVAPHTKHKIGNIQIFSDTINNIKEIIIQPNSKVKDILNLVHSLSRDMGVILTTDGKDFFELKGKHIDDDKLVTKIIEFIQKNPGLQLILLFKPSSPFGGHFVGGAFTDILYNKNQLSNLIYTKHLSSHRLGKGIGNIKNDSFHPKIKLIQTIV